MTEIIKVGDTITVDYTGKLKNGEEFDSSQGKTPLKFTVGAGILINGFDNAVIGMRVGDSKTVTIPPEEGYGLRNEEAFVEIKKNLIPGEIPLAVGLVLELQGPEGQPIPASVAEIGDELVKMDINHRLAGKTLIFDITVNETGLEPDVHQCGCGSNSHGCRENDHTCGSDSEGGCGCGC